MMNTMKLKFLLAALAVLLVLAGGWYAWSNHLFSTSPLQVDDTDTSGVMFVVASSTGETYFSVTSNGRVGVRNSAPATTFDVNGLARAVPMYTLDVGACTSELEGAFYYDRLHRHFFGCDAEAWKQLDN